MLTRNFKQLILGRAKSNNNNTALTSIKTLDGTISDNARSDYFGELSTNRYNMANNCPCICIIIGSGNVSPSYEDYKLENMIDVAPTSINKFIDTSYENSRYLITALFENSTSDEWSISEAGVTASIPGTKCGLISREVFDPIIVPVGGSVTITMTIN